MEKKFNAWMPVTKNSKGEFVGILSDNSMDRDKEFMSKGLLQKWATQNKGIKALANHENKMQSWVGGWTDLQLLEKGVNTALVAKPWFFSKDANPLADQIRRQVEEAIDNGEAPGISIGALPSKSDNKEIDGEYHKVYEEAELLEATWVPIQSNRNATFGHIAKKFDYEECSNDTQKHMEESETMVKEIKKEDSPAEAPVEEAKVEEKVPEEEKVEAETEEEVVEEEAEPVKEEPKEEPKEEEAAPAEVPAEEVKPTVEELQAEVDAAKAANAKLQKENDSLKNQAILKGTVDGPISKEVPEDEGDLTVEKMLKIRYSKK